MINIDTFKTLYVEDMKFMDIEVPAWAKDVRFNIWQSPLRELKLVLSARVQNTEEIYYNALFVPDHIRLPAVMKFISQSFDAIKRKHENQTKRNLQGQ